MSNDDGAPTTLADLPLEAIECRGLRHAWPRRSNPSHARFFRFEVTEKRGRKVIAGVLHMMCTGDCGTERKEPRRLNHEGRMVRDGRLDYKRHKPYLLKRADANTPMDRVDPDELQDTMMRRMFPDLKW